ncbi:hypothetical protein JSQ81_09460 [Sporosarcina sp. Marseille-Q4063]|uniref:hypothetical protein n=1 Tax=Sporosarcina sp. Marseille-Q4063 TaxID=2810514 RepID=UPI001BAEC697|nr:hypothetical protein [Sporosarcina sp. Marseille-Q4063]QUW23701.1 hypothetical protein JSQ81_09460 [Sporosarcina sp. Marseille-Q4063]
MKNKSMDKSYFDEQLKQLDKDIIWEEKRKSKLENKILFTMDSNRYKNKTKLFGGFKYALNLGIVVILLLFGYYFLSNSIIHQGGESSTGNEGNQTNNNPIIDDKNDHEEVEKDAPENDENQGENQETNMEIHTGSSETVIRNVEGEDLEVKIINYHIQPYGIAYQFDEAFGVPEVSNNKITYSTEYDYEITLEMIEHTNLEKAVSKMQERFEAEGYEENYELESTHVEENGLIGKIQFYGDHPMKGFIAYEINEQALVITFQYPIEGADAMNPILETLRRSIKVQ